LPAAAATAGTPSPAPSDASSAADGEWAGSPAGGRAQLLPAAATPPLMARPLGGGAPRSSERRVRAGGGAGDVATPKAN
jgi:hypothetical protein